MDPHQEWKPVFQNVVYRALCDALGFTNLPKDEDEHKRTVNEARAWFIEGGREFQTMVELAGFDPTSVRQAAAQLIYARSTGDFTKVAPYWREVFRLKRGPNLTNIERALANWQDRK